MRHPFDGVVTPKASRRGWLKVFAGAVAGWFGYAAISEAVGPPKNVKLVPHESAGQGAVTKALTPAETGGGAATLALNEQGGKAMTRALNEQGGRVTKAKAGAEAGGVRPVRPVRGVTTLALGEEGGKN